MTTYNHLSATGMAHFLTMHFGNPDTTLVTGEHFLAPVFTRNLKGLRIPDLLIAFDVDPAAFKASNAYVIEEQGKPPDFVLEVASRSTGRRDVGEKREYYERVGVQEFWRFDETGRFHGARLGGDRLIDGRYEPIPLETLPNGDLQGFSAVLNLWLRWEAGQLHWYDPETGQHIITLAGECEARRAEQRARLLAEAGWAAESVRADAAEARAETERLRAEAAEALVRELRAEARRRDRPRRADE